MNVHAKSLLNVRSAVAEPVLSEGAKRERRRTRIWELDRQLHCSIIGTCLSSAELRQLLVRLGVLGAASAGDHELHRRAVILAASAREGGKLLQKLLDRTYRGTINHFVKAKDAESLARLWQEALKLGEIPGAYWATLTHPAASEALIAEVFGDVHMLSHLMGAANRADIRQLRQLERTNAELTDKIERQQRQLHEGFSQRDATIKRLARELAESVGKQHQGSEATDTDSPLHAAVSELNRQLAAQIAHRRRLECRIEKLTSKLAQLERKYRELDGERQALGRELSLIEQNLAQQTPSMAGGPCLRMNGETVLYVGGRAHQVPQCRSLVERAGGSFLHHDGGVEHSYALLPRLVSRAHIVIFPIDCVSHQAVSLVKRCCGQSDKPYVPLRTSGLTSLISALFGMVGAQSRASPANTPALSGVESWHEATRESD